VFMKHEMDAKVFQLTRRCKTTGTKFFSAFSDDPHLHRPVNDAQVYDFNRIREPTTGQSSGYHSRHHSQRRYRFWICWVGRRLRSAPTCVRDSGALISIFEPLEGRKPEDVENDLKNLFFIMEPDGKQLAEISRLLGFKECRPVVDSCLEVGGVQESVREVGLADMRRGRFAIKIAE